MNDFEEQLHGRPLARPSDDLDRRMEGLFATRMHAQPRVRRFSKWWLVFPAAAAAGMAFLLRPQPVAPAPVAAHYQAEAQGALREWLLTPSPESGEPPRLIISVQPQPVPSNP